MYTKREFHIGLATFKNLYCIVIGNVRVMSILILVWTLGGKRKIKLFVNIFE